MIIIGALIAIFFGVSLIFRISLPYDGVFTGEWIKFTRLDAYWHMRLVDTMAYNFPNLTQFDPFFIYPGGGIVGGVHFFDWLLSGVAWLFGLGSPTQHTVDVVGVTLPAVLGALTVIPVYFIGKALFNRGAGVIAAALVAVLPGEFLGRTILGSADHHVAETLFAAVALLFLILAIKDARQKQFTFSHLIQRDWSVITRLLVYSVLAGIFLGIYLLTWFGGLLFVFIIAVYLIIQFIIDHLRGRSTDYLCLVGFVSLFVTAVITLSVSYGSFSLFTTVVTFLIPVVLYAISLLISRRGLKPVYYPLTLVGLGVVFIVIFWAIVPDMLSGILRMFTMVFVPGGATAATTMEMQPFLSPRGSFTTAAAWGSFTTSFFLATWWLIPGFFFAAICGFIYHYYWKDSDGKPWLISLSLCVVIMIISTLAHPPSEYNLSDILPIPGFALIAFVILIWLIIKRRSDEKNWLLFLIWTLVMLAVTLAQRRFAYYLVINVALLSAYISWQAIWLAGFKKLVAKPEEIPEGAEAEGAEAKMKEGHGKSRGITTYYINVTLAIIVVFLFVLYPNITMAKGQASLTPFAPSDGWHSSLLWMKENTPEPLGDPDAYYKFYEAPPPGEDFEYPESAYGVTSWWDYGYWISRTAHRLPSTNNSQAPGPITKVANLFLSTEESTADEIMRELESSYIIADYAVSTNKFYAVATWAERPETEFMDIYYIPYEDRAAGKPLYYPEYYRSMHVRLYNFDGKAVTDVQPWVVTYEEVVDTEGYQLKFVTDRKQFSSYEEALEYVESQDEANCRIVGSNPFVSPIPLEALENYQIIYSSEYLVLHKDLSLEPEWEIITIPVPEVKIFEYIGD